MPPMLDITFDILLSRGPQDMGPGNFRPGKEQGHAVLQLIPETVGAPAW